MIHIGSWKKQENLTILAENVLPRPAPTLYKFLAPPLLDRFCSNFGSRREIQFWKKSQSLKSLRQTVSELESKNHRGGAEYAPPRKE